MSPASVFLSLIAILTGSLLVARAAHCSRNDKGWQGPLLALLSLLTSLLSIELYFNLHEPLSDNFAFTRSAHRWRERYWHPINTAGYRDYVWPSADEIREQRLVLVIGDSFAAGAGIKSIDQRFSGVLGKLLGDGWRVVTLAKPGSGPLAQRKFLERFPLPADVVIYTYYINDVTDAALELGQSRSFAFEESPSLLGLLSLSDAADTLYWRYIRVNSGAFGQEYWDFLRTCFQSDKTLNTHLRHLTRLDAAAPVDSHRFAVLFPHLPRVSETQSFTKQVAEHYGSIGVNVLDLAPLLLGRDPGNLVVNSIDYHPSIEVHREVGELLTKDISEIEW